MTRKTLHIWWTIEFLFITLYGFSQNLPSAKATVDRNQILIGEPIQLSLEAKMPLGLNMSWFALDSIPHFNVIEKGSLDSVETADGKSYHQRLVITSFDSGLVLIPALPMLVNNKKYSTDSIPIEVSFSQFDPRQDYHDIKDILEIENPYTRYIIWLVLILTVISAALFAYLVMKEEMLGPVVQQPVVPQLSPFEEAMKSMQELKRQGLPDKTNSKLFYTRLNDILRLFVFRQLNISSMEKTNEELILQLRQMNMSPEQFSQLAESLRMSDFVKFAKYIPDQYDNEKNFEIIESSIKLLNEMEK